MLCAFSSEYTRGWARPTIQTVGQSSWRLSQWLSFWGCNKKTADKLKEEYVSPLARRLSEEVQRGGWGQLVNSGEMNLSTPPTMNDSNSDSNTIAPKVFKGLPPSLLNRQSVCQYLLWVMCMCNTCANEPLSPRWTGWIEQEDFVENTHSSTQVRGQNGESCSMEEILPCSF